MTTVSTFVFLILTYSSNLILTKLALQTGEMDPCLFSFMKVAAAAFIMLAVLPNAVTQFAYRNNFSLLTTSLLFVSSIFTLSIALSDLGLVISSLLLYGSSIVFRVLFNISPKNIMTNLASTFSIIIISIGAGMFFELPSIANYNHSSLVLIIFSGVSFALFSPDKSQIKLSYQWLRRLFMMSAIVGFILFFSIVVKSSYVAFNIDGIIYAIVTGTFSTGMFYCLWLFTENKFVSHMTGLFSVIIVILWGMIVSAESISTSEVSAGTLIILGILIHTLASPTTYTSPPEVNSDTTS
ncbi:hypothetical protein [Methylophaga thiooxydans]|uniref:hypothetical protein n=1 Tax=Methylophaga thiooxydans TaxID=392484 RepID=UPI002353CF7B|nr:hypothetical protein [Methylophaga thiooxydans]